MRAWTQFVAEGDEEAERSAPRSCAAGSSPASSRPTSPHAPLDDEGDTAEFWNQSPLQTAVSRVAGRAAPHRRGRRPRHRDHRRADPDPVDLRRSGDAPQGRDGQLRARRALGRASVGTNALGHRRPHRRPVDGLQRRALRRGRAQLGLLGRAGARPGDRRPLGVIDLSTTWDRTHPIGLATARVMARLIETAMPADRRATPARDRRARRARPHADPARHRRGLARRPAAAAQPAPDRDPRPARAAPRRALARAPARAGLRRPGGHHLHAQGRGVAPARGPVRASSPRAPTG